MLAGLLGAFSSGASAQESQPVVHAVLFYSPSCGHCEYVITQTLPPLYEKYGKQLQIIGFDVTQPQGQTMFSAAMEKFGVLQAAVPLLVIDDITLTGSQEIPEQFPQLIEAYLSLGGVDWPAIPGLREMLIAAAQAATAQPSAPSSSAPALPLTPSGGMQPSGWQGRFAADPVGNGISVVVLVGMIIAAGWGAHLFRTGRGTTLESRPRPWLIPVLSILGLLVAGYLAFVESTGMRAACGPIGDCNTVQQSPYARLFGVLSVGTLGLIGYLGMGAAWAVARFAPARLQAGATRILFGLAALGTLFSIYLTFLEPFVIGATCAWCLASAVLTTGLMLLSVGPAATTLGAARAATVAPIKRRAPPRRSRTR